MLVVTADAAFTYDAAVGDKSPHKVYVDFDANVGGSLDASDLVVDNVTTGQSMAGKFVLESYNATTHVAIFAYDPDDDPDTLDVLPDGNYRAVISPGDISAGGSGTLAEPMVLDFFVLSGDLTDTNEYSSSRNRVVDGDDLNVVELSYFGSGLTYSYGNADYDVAGNVGIDDWNLVNAQIGKILAPPPGNEDDLSVSTLAPGQVTLNWVDQQVGETGWRIQISENGSDFSNAAHKNVRANATSYTFTGLTPGQQYWFRVRAYSESSINPHGPSTAYSPKESIVPMIGLPQIVSWTEPSSTTASLEIKRQENVTHYRFYEVYLNEESELAVEQFDEVEVPGSGNFTEVFTRSTNQTFMYAVSAYNEDTDTESGMTYFAAAAAPTGLSVSINGSDQFVLTWTDNSTSENGYSIQRRVADLGDGPLLPDDLRRGCATPLAAGTILAQRWVAAGRLPLGPARQRGLSPRRPRAHPRRASRPTPSASAAPPVTVRKTGFTDTLPPSGGLRRSRARH